MHTKAYKDTRIARRVYRTSPSLPPPSDRRALPPEALRWPDIRARALGLLQNPLFLVIVTWLVMAGMLVMEMLGGE